MPRILLIVLSLAALQLISFSPVLAQRTGMKVEQLAMEGRQFTAEQAADAEKSLESNPDDLDQRVRLLGHYFFQRLRVKSAEDRFTTHALWIIEHHPAHPAAGSIYVRLDKILQPKAYAKATELWLKHMEAKPDDAAIISNAGEFFTIHERTRALELLERASKIDPDNMKLHERVGEAYLLNARFGKDAVADAKRALTSLEKALNKSEGMARFYLLTKVARAALLAQETEKAAQYATELIDTAVEHAESDWNFGNAVHHGNLILGHIALKKDDVETAERHLIKAGRTPGSPQLNSFGPNMALAKALLEKGRKEAVIEYLKLCGKFWNAQQTAAWIKTIEDGKTPQFGANLVY